MALTLETTFWINLVQQIQHQLSKLQQQLSKVQEAVQAQQQTLETVQEEVQDIASASFVVNSLSLAPVNAGRAKAFD